VVSPKAPVAGLAPLPVGFPQKLQVSARHKEVPVDNMVFSDHTQLSADRKTAPLLTLLPTLH